MADAEVHLMLVKAHLAALAVAEPPEVELQEGESLPSIGLAGGEADAAQRIVEPGKERSPTPRPGAERGNGSSGGSLQRGAPLHDAAANLHEQQPEAALPGVAVPERLPG